jgi:hypothetical protein
MAVYVQPPKEATPEQNELFSRIDTCEKKIDKVFKYLTSFGGDTA